MKKIILSGCLLLVLNNSNAQSLSPFVIASAGDFFSNISGSLSFTVAEMAMVETFSSTNHKLTQGFQQPVPNTVTAINSPLLPGVSIKLFPNPTSGKIFISLTTPYTISVSGTLYDATGRKISIFQMHQFSGQQNGEYILSNLSSGVYIVELLLKRQTATAYEKLSSKIYITH